MSPRHRAGNSPPPRSNGRAVDFFVRPLSAAWRERVRLEPLTRPRAAPSSSRTRTFGALLGTKAETARRSYQLHSAQGSCLTALPLNADESITCRDDQLLVGGEQPYVDIAVRQDDGMAAADLHPHHHLY